MMIRSELLKSIVPVITDQLGGLQHRPAVPGAFPARRSAEQLLHAGHHGAQFVDRLGLALAQSKKVIAIDGDGSILTNLATLATIANNDADNFILLIVDNGSYGSTGDQPTYAGRKTSLAAVARACGCEHVVECGAEDTAGEINGLPSKATA